MWHDKSGELSAIASTHVDDLKLTGTDKQVAYILQGLEKKVGKLKTAVGEFEHCGIKHRQMPSGEIVIHQNHYSEQLGCLALPVGVNLESLCSEADHSAYQSLLGAVAWTVNTRAEIAIFVGALQRVAKSPRYIDLKRLNTVLKFMKKHPMDTVFRRLVGPLKIIAVSDSAFKRQDESPLACRGSLTLLCTDTQDVLGGNIHILDYDCKKQKRVTRSTYGAELHGLADSMEATRIIACAYTELYRGAKTFDQLCKIENEGGYHYPVEACLDAKSVYDSIVHADLKTPQEKSLINILGQMREHMSYRRIRRLRWIDTRDMLADGLNKGAISRRALLTALTKGTWLVEHPTVSAWSKGLTYNDFADDNRFETGEEVD